MKNITKQFLFTVLSLSCLLFVGCYEEDLTGASTQEVAQGVQGTIAFVAPLTATKTVNEAAAETFEFTITLNKPQSVPIHIYVKQVGGNADSDDFKFSNDIEIPAYATTATGTISISNDDIQEGTESFTLQIGDETTSNATVAPKNVTITIQNSTLSSLKTELSWSTAIKDVTGELISPTAAANLRLLITKLDYNTSAALQTIDASTTAFESYEMLSTYADGTYLVVADAKSYKDMGSQGFFDVDLTVKFNQAGVYNNKTFTFPKALNSAGLTPCGATSYFKLAQITKSGSNYTISEVGTPGFTFNASIFSGPYTVILDEWEDYVPVPAPINLVYNAADGTATFRIIYTAVATPNAYISVTFNQATGVVTKIVESEPLKYNLASLTTYGVSGTGTVNFCTGAVNLNVTWKNLRTGATYPNYKFNLTKN